MEDENKIEPEYVKGFNEGYTLAQHMPDLADKLAKIDSDFIRLTGFKAGREQYQAEQVKTRLPSWLTGERPAKGPDALDKNRDRDIDLEK